MASKGSEKIELEMIKKYYKYEVQCPICKVKHKIGVEIGDLKDINQFPFPHIYLHGNPIHALIVYIDKQFKVRGVEGCATISVQKSSETLQQMIRRWSNPF